MRQWMLRLTGAVTSYYLGLSNLCLRMQLMGIGVARMARE